MSTRPAYPSERGTYSSYSLVTSVVLINRAGKQTLYSWAWAWTDLQNEWGFLKRLVTVAQPWHSLDARADGDDITSPRHVLNWATRHTSVGELSWTNHITQFKIWQYSIVWFDVRSRAPPRFYKVLFTCASKTKQNNPNQYFDPKLNIWKENELTISLLRPNLI